jgi:ribosomal protein S18 acetylase RimI-like enzyme
VIRTAGPLDVRFLRDMLRHAYYWRMGAETEDPVFRYVRNWGRPGDSGLIALEDGNPVGAAWYRLFRRDAPGFGFVDERTPELTIAVVPSRRGRGIGHELLTGLLERAHREGYDAVSLSVERDSPAVKLYERYGFERVKDTPSALVMRAELGSPSVGGGDDGV